MSLTHIETIELGSSQSSITFSSIPQDYDDLKLLVSARSDNSGFSSFVDDLGIYLNGSSANQTKLQLFGQPTSVFTNTSGYANVNGVTSTSNTFGSLEAYISNYTASQNKSVSIDFVTENNGGDSRQGISSLLWSQTAAVTSIQLLVLNGSLVSGCTFSLYGVTSGGSGTVTTS